jgi:hypothetical protein
MKALQSHLNTVPVFLMLGIMKLISNTNLYATRDGRRFIQQPINDMKNAIGGYKISSYNPSFYIEIE